MFSKFLQYFYTQQKVSINFINDQKEGIKMYLDYKTMSSPENTASIIYALSVGLFLDKIIKILLEDIKNNKNKKLAENILNKLDELYILDQQNDMMIKPLETFDKNVK